MLLLDESTSLLTEDEVRLVLRLIHDLAAQGTGIVFISHYLSEVFEVCDEITVLRDGAVVLAAPTSTTSLPSVVSAMIGRRLEVTSRRTESTRSAEPLLEVRGLSVRNGPHDASFTLHKGEILGITGLTGSGLTELAKVIFASPDTRRDGGSVVMDGQELSLRDPSDALAAGIVLFTNDRLHEGVLPDFTIQENVVLLVLTASPDSSAASTCRWSAWSRARSSDGCGCGYPAAYAGAFAQRRQSAEGAVRQVTGHQAARVHHGRADHRHRRGLQGRDPPADPGHRGGRRQRGPDHRRDRRADHPVRPRPGHVQRQVRGRTGERGNRARGHPARLGQREDGGLGASMAGSAVPAARASCRGSPTA